MWEILQIIQRYDEPIRINILFETLSVIENEISKKAPKMLKNAPHTVFSDVWALIWKPFAIFAIAHKVSDTLWVCIARVLIVQ